jgi:hypothetical protein
MLNSGPTSQTKPQTYRVIRLIGEGAYGKAYLVECNADKVMYYILTLISLYVLLKRLI